MTCFIFARGDNGSDAIEIQITNDVTRESRGELIIVITLHKVLCMYKRPCERERERDFYHAHVSKEKKQTKPAFGRWMQASALHIEGLRSSIHMLKRPTPWTYLNFMLNWSVSKNLSIAMDPQVCQLHFYVT